MKDIWPPTFGRDTNAVHPAEPASDADHHELTNEEKHLRFVRHLVEHGYLTGDTAGPTEWAA